jgi:hypothetical protein
VSTVHVMEQNEGFGDNCRAVLEGR